MITKKLAFIMFILLVGISVVGAVVINNPHLPSINAGGSDPITSTLTLMKSCALDLGILSCQTCTMTINNGVVVSTTC